MPDIKKIIKNIASESLEMVKDSAKQIKETVGPDALLNQALGKKPGSNEMGDYLKNLGDPALTGEKFQDRKAELDEQANADLAKTRQILESIPAHMKLPPKEKELSPHEKDIKEKEEKERKEEELRIAQAKNTLNEPAGTLKGPKTKGKKRGSSGFEGKGFEGKIKDAKPA